MSAGGDGGEKKKVGRGPLDQYSVSVLSTEFQYLALIKKSSVCSSNVLSCSWYSVSLPRDGKDLGIDEGSFGVLNRNVPLLHGPLVGVFLAIGIHQLKSFSWVLKKLNFVKFHFDLGFRKIKSG